MILCNVVQWLFNISKDNFATLFEACHLNTHDFTDTLFIFFDILDAFVIFDHSGDAEVQTAKDNFLLNVFNKSQDICVDFESANFVNISVNEAVTNALSSVTEYLMVQFSGALVNFSSFSDVIHYFLVKHIHFAHFFIHLRKERHVLRRILNHGWREWSLLPELLVVLHGIIDFIFLFVDLAQIVLEKVVQADVDVSVVVLLKEVRDQAMGYLGVEHKVTNDIELADKG